MTKLLIAAAFGALAIAAPAAAHHVENLDTPYPSRGACEAASAELSADDHEFLLVIGPDLFDSVGDAASFLTRAFTCEVDQSDGQWYITDHRVEVLDSDWFGKK